MKLKLPTVQLTETIYVPERLTVIEAPQVALSGRSNVGKSSLLNTLSGRGKLAKVGSTPGKTQSINFYHIQPYDFYLVDLPGYGYAKRSKAERNKWARLIERYFQTAEKLVAVAVLLDSRLAPQQSDLDMISYLQAENLTIIPVLTKIDKCNQSQRAKAQKQWSAFLESDIKPLSFSAVKGTGRDSLWLKIFNILDIEPLSADTGSSKDPE